MDVIHQENMAIMKMLLKSSDGESVAKAWNKIYKDQLNNALEEARKAYGEE